MEVIFILVGAINFNSLKKKKNLCLVSPKQGRGPEDATDLRTIHQQQQHNVLDQPGPGSQQIKGDLRGGPAGSEEQAHTSHFVRTTAPVGKPSGTPGSHSE